MSDERKRRSHTIRLTVSMLVGILLGAWFMPVVGNGLDPWFRAAPLIYTASGALAGLGLELFRRFLEQPAYTEHR